MKDKNKLKQIFKDLKAGLIFPFVKSLVERTQKLERLKIRYGKERFEKAERLSVITVHDIFFWIHFDIDFLNKQLKQYDS